MKQIIATSIITLCLGLSPAFAAKKPELPVDSRIRVFTYTPSDVYTIPTKYGYQTSVVFAPNEEIGTISVGDRSQWQIIPSGNRIFIRPMDDNLTTNMTVITNQREYTFDIKSVAEKSNANLYVIQFRYPDGRIADEEETNSDDVLAPTPSKRVLTKRAAEESNTSIPPLDTQRTQSPNDKYTYSGPEEIAPAQVFDDGKHTYVVYDTMPMPAPVPFVTGGKGQPVVAAHKVRDNKIIINLVAGGFVLKSQAGDIVVYNESFKQ